MNRRTFMKAVGVGLVALAVPVAKVATSAPTVDELVAAGIAERCEGSFIPEWHEHKGYVSGLVTVANPVQMNMMWVGKINHLPMTIWIKDEGYVSFDAGTLLVDGISCTRDDMKGDFSCRLTFTQRLTGGFNDDMEIYERANLVELLGRCEWSEIKEKV